MSIFEKNRLEKSKILHIDFSLLKSPQKKGGETAKLISDLPTRPVGTSLDAIRCVISLARVLRYKLFIQDFEFRRLQLQQQRHSTTDF